MAPLNRSRWTTRIFKTLGLRGLAMAGALGLCLGAARGQDPNDPGTGAMSRSFLNKTLIHLPIEIDSGYRSQINSLVLFVKEGQNGQWTQRDKAAPMQTSFTFKAPRDGEYWFRIVAIDNQGRSHPDDLNKDPQDAVALVIDTVPPTVELGLGPNTPEGQIVQVDMRDANPDAFKMRFFYQTRDQVWRHLESMPDGPHLFCVPSQAALTNFIRVAAADMAGNTTARTLNLAELAPAKQAARPTAPAPVAAPVQQPVAQMPAALPPVTPPHVAQQPVAQQPPPICNVPASLPPVIAQQQAPVAPPNPLPVPLPVPVSNEPVRVGPSLDPQSVEPRSSHHQHPINRPQELETTSGTLSRQITPQAAAPNVQIVNATQVFLNYAVENIGASGVGKLDIYATRDRGQSWHKVAEESARKNPLEVNLPGEGVFGLKLVAANGRGFGAQAPQAGDPADWWVEVDATKPKATITGLRPGVGHESGSLHVIWQAEDKNIGTDSAELFYAPSREGPWTPIAKNLKCVGQHRWTPPSDAGPHAFIRLIVRDKAGNVGLCETTQPVPLDDNSRPRVRLLGVTSSPSATTSGLGAIQPVQTTNVPVEHNYVQPARYSTSNFGVDVR